MLTTQWLTKNGYSKQLISRYCESGWLESIGHGAYTRSGDVLTWSGAIYALQHDLNLPIHVGGLSAIEQHGLAHNIVFDKEHRSLFFYNTEAQKRKLPSWFKKYFTQHVYIQRHLFTEEIGLEKKQIDNISVILSAPERAILELLDSVPNAFSYEHANNIIENLYLLRPDLLQALLEKCTSIKVKRLFLYLADKHQLPSFPHLDLKKISLGKGKRVIGSGGKYISQYKLAVPVIRSDSDEEDIGHV